MIIPERQNPPAVAALIADFLVRTEQECLDLFRLHLQTTVRRVSPLLLDLAKFDDIPLDDAMALMHPPPTWPRRPLYDVRPGMVRSSQRYKYWLRSVGSRGAWHFERTFASPGIVIRKLDHPRGRFAIRPCGPVLGFTADLGECLLSAYCSTAHLKLAGPLPDSLMASLAGRVLSEVVDHPIFAGRSYRIRHVKTDPFEGVAVISFGAKTLPFEGPWASPSNRQ